MLLELFLALFCLTSATLMVIQLKDLLVSGVRARMTSATRFLIVIQVLSVVGMTAVLTAGGWFP